MPAASPKSNVPIAGANDHMYMSPEARVRMRKREVDMYKYYDDGGPGRGHCTWGAGILAHRGPCTKDELARPVSKIEADAEYARRVAKAEREVRSSVRKQALTQEQFDALVSLTYNAGARGRRGLISRRAEESAPFAPLEVPKKN